MTSAGPWAYETDPSPEARWFAARMLAAAEALHLDYPATLEQALANVEGRGGWGPWVVLLELEALIERKGV